MRQYLYSILIIIVLILAAGTYFFSNYWIHRYDDLIAEQAKIYNLDADLVWSIIYEETYFRAWILGEDKEIGLMQVTPTVAREWAKETGFQEFEQRAANDVVDFLQDPKRNIQIGCWYLEKLGGKYRTLPAEKAMTLAAYNAGASRVEEWTKDTDVTELTEAEFINRINIASTKSYVSSILERYKTKENRIDKPQKDENLN
jgi:soluble lytic murein transglycosylase